MANQPARMSAWMGIFAVICLVASFMITPLPWAEEPASAQETAEGRFIIAWEQGRDSLDMLLSLARRDQHIKVLLDAVPGLLERLREGAWAAPQLQSVVLPGGSVPDAVRGVLEVMPGVRYVEEDARVSAGDATSEPYYSQQWHLPRIGAVRAWEESQGNPGVVVGVVDSGVDASHPDLAGRVIGGYDFVDGDEDARDENGHGTHVAGIIAAAGDNGIGVAGVAWRTQILPVRVLDESGYGYYSDVIAGIRYAADHGARVINLSLGGASGSQALQEAVDYAYAKGCSVVAAAGNNGLDSVSYPAACDHVTAVGASDLDDRPATFSNRGAGLDLIAPGVSIYSTLPRGRYGSMSGTSMASPQVSGAFALLYSVRPELVPAEAERVLTANAADLGPGGRDDSTGWGLLQVDRAIVPQNPVTDDPGGRIYFAEGYTGAGFDTYVLLENPASQGCAAEIELYGGSGPLYSAVVDVGPRARVTLHLNELVPPGDVAVGISVPEGSVLKAQRSMYFDYRGLKDGHTTQASGAATEWHFAEGYTGPGFDTYILVFNPEPQAANATLRLMTPGDSTEVNLQVAPLARHTVRLNDLMPGAEIATVLCSDVPVVAERAMYFDKNGIRGGSVVMGAESASQDRYFAEGYTGGKFDEWLLLANPSDTMVTAITSFLRSDGVTVERETVLQPRSRATIHVNEVPGLENAEVSARVRAAYPGVVAERAMYFSYNGSMGEVSGGHAAMGAVAPSSSWLIPEGYTGPGFECWILISNLEDEAVTVSVQLMGESGAEVKRDFVVGPHSRFTVKENTLLPGEGVSAAVSAAEGTRLVVEGAFYFRYRGDIDGGST